MDPSAPPKMGKRQLSASQKRVVWLNAVTVSRQKQQKLLARKRKKEERENDSELENQERDKLLHRCRKKSFLVSPGKRKRKKKDGIKDKNKVANFIKKMTPSQRLKFITACIIARIKITSILFMSLL